MNDEHEKFLKSLRATFFQEAEEDTQKLQETLGQMGRAATPDQKRRLCQQALQRVQTMVAAAQAAEVNDVVRLCSSLEGLFESAANHVSNVSSDVTFTLGTVVDNLAVVLSGLSGRGPVVAPSEIEEAIEMMRGVRQQILTSTMDLADLLAAPPVTAPEQPLVRPELMKRLQDVRNDPSATLYGEGLTEFELELFETFRVEAAEHLEALNKILNQIQREPDEANLPALYHTANRAAHTLKGASRAVEVAEVEAVSECVEHVFAPFKARPVRISPGFMQALRVSVQALERLLSGRRESVRDRVELTLYIIKQLSRLNLNAPDKQLPLDLQLPAEQPVVREEPRPALAATLADELHHRMEQPENTTQELPPEFLAELMATFASEAREQIDTMSGSLLSLEKSITPAEREETLEILFRGIHTLKGGARAVGLTEVESVCQVLESICSRLKKRQIVANTSTYDVLLSAMGLLSDMLDGERPDIQPLMSKLAMIEAGFVTAVSEAQGRPAPAPPQPTPMAPAQPSDVAPVAPLPPVAGGPATTRVDRAAGETVRIPTAKLDSLFAQVEEMLAAKLTLAQRHEDLRSAGLTEDNWRREWAKILPDLKTLQKLVKRRERVASAQLYDAGGKLLEFLTWNQNAVRSYFGRLRNLTTAADGDTREIGGMVDNLQEDMKRLLMLPFSMILAAFPRSVREIARSLGKDVELSLQGTEVEIDRRILEEMKDPLLHLIRNAVYHGIEDNATRARAGKSRTGRVELSITQVFGGKVEIVLADDGGGIDVERVKRAAVAAGLVSHSELERMSEPEVLSLIYQSDLSTSDKVTDIAGRGLGLAIVRDRIKELGGSISVESHLGAGTRFIMRLPLTLATARGVLVRAAGQLYVVPTLNVERVLRIRPAEVKTVDNRETIYLQGNPVPIARLEDLLEMSQAVLERDYVMVLVLEAGDKRLAVSVDEVLSEQEVLVKGLGQQLRRVRNILGATILGSGQIAPILHVADLIVSANQHVRKTERRMPIALAPPTTKKRIMVVDDSITSRSLIRNILESVGYLVKTAVDGVEALAALRAESVDLVVSDVEMPRMNGVVLTEKIRADKTLAALPVVLVTTLDSKQDRERGTEAGANAYIVKGGFNQSNLLNTIRRLI